MTQMTPEALSTWGLVHTSSAAEHERRAQARFVLTGGRYNAQTRRETRDARDSSDLPPAGGAGSAPESNSAGGGTIAPGGAAGLPAISTEEEPNEHPHR